tara:strand:+ start:12607 stop:13716 length:1110 start_codon:yes stop_codon:yes gene_type:complete
MSSKKNIQLIKELNKEINKKIESTSSLIKNKSIYFQNIFKEKTKNIKNINPSLFFEKLQDKIESTVKSDNRNNVILTQSRFWASSLTWVLIGGTTFALGWLSIAKTDEVVIALGKLEPKGGVIDVQMPLEGVTSEILVKEGDIVQKGQVLMRLDPKLTKAKSIVLKNSLDINNTIKDKLENLVAVGAVSELQYLEQQLKIEEIKSQIKRNSIILKYQEISSPIDGKVFDLQPKEIGYVARPGEPLLKIVPFDNLLAKVEIDSRTIGFVKAGKKAEVSIDSFPATDFGVLEGTVTSIGSDALPPDRSLGKGYRFPATIRLNKQYLKVKSGKKLPLQAGMSLTANIKLRKVTYIQLFLSKFTDKAQSLKSI